MSFTNLQGQVNLSYDCVLSQSSSMGTGNTGPKTLTTMPPSNATTSTSLTLRPAKVTPIKRPQALADGRLQYDPADDSVMDADMRRLCGASINAFAQAEGWSPQEAEKFAWSRAAPLMKRLFTGGMADFESRLPDVMPFEPGPEQNLTRCAAELALGYFRTARTDVASGSGGSIPSVPSAPVRTLVEERDSANHSACISPMIPGQDAGAGSFGAFRNSCNYSVFFTMCVESPEEGSWGSTLDCAKPLRNLDGISANDVQASHVTGGKRVHWFACRKPASPKGAKFDGQRIVASCS